MMDPINSVVGPGWTRNLHGGTARVTLALSLAAGAAALLSAGCDSLRKTAALSRQPVSATEPAALPTRAIDLPGTTVTATLNQAIEPGRNVVWCASLQLAWNELRRLNRGDVHLAPRAALAEQLNAAKVNRDDCDEASVVAMAGLTTDGIVEKIRTALDRKFGGHRRLDLLTIPELTESLVVTYAQMLKDLRFPQPLERLGSNPFFAGDPWDSYGQRPTTGVWEVQTFGVRDADNNPVQARQADQVRILWHHVDPAAAQTRFEQFIIELKTDSNADRLILASIKPEKTLGQTVDKVVALIQRPNDVGSNCPGAKSALAPRNQHVPRRLLIPAATMLWT